MRYLIAIFTLLFLFGCGGGQSAKPTPPVEEKKTPPKQEKKKEVKKEEPKKKEKDLAQAAFNLQTVLKQHDFTILIMYFEFNRSKLPEEAGSKIDEAAKKLNALVEILEKNNSTEKVKVKVYGYADRRGSLEYNLKLSKKRAQNVLNELKTKVKQSDLLEYEIKGFGFTDLFKPEDPRSGQNRRVAIFI